MLLIYSLASNDFACVRIALNGVDFVKNLNVFESQGTCIMNLNARYMSKNLKEFETDLREDISFSFLEPTLASSLCSTRVSLTPVRFTPVFWIPVILLLWF